MIGVALPGDDMAPAGGPIPESGVSSRLPSWLAVNLFLVAGIVLLIVSSRLETSTLTRHLLGIVVEVTLALMALLFMRLERLDVRKTGRFQIPDARMTLLAALLAPGIWVMGVGLNLFSALIFGYTSPVTPSQYPANALEALAFAATTILAAPVCEEIMFRGYVQRAYEHRSVWTGIVVGGLIFALYHLRFQGVFALVPAALALGFVAWRTGSLIPAMLLHAIYNTIATVILIFTSFLPFRLSSALILVVVGLNVVLAPVSLAALWLLYKRTSSVEAFGLALRPSPRPAWFRWVWALPAVALAGVYTYAAVNEVLVQRFPERVVQDDLSLESPGAWDDQVMTWDYEVQNRFGQSLGSAMCSRTPQEAYYVIECEADHEGSSITDAFPGFVKDLEGFDWNELPFDSFNFSSAFQIDPQSWTLSGAWSQPELELASFDLIIDSPGQTPLEVALSAEEDERVLEVQRLDMDSEILPLVGDRVLLPYEWAWRFGALPFDLPYGGNVTVIDVDDSGAVSLYPGYLKVAGGEPSWTPAGTYVTWRVTLSWENEVGERQTHNVWYDSEPPYTLVRYDDGSVSYLLTSLEPLP